MIRTIHLPTGAAALPPSVRARLEDPPRPGTGVHNWIYGTALAMLNFVSADECVELLRECIPRKPKPYNEIEMQVQSALDMRESGQTVSRKRRPEFPMDENSPCKVLEKARSGLDNPSVWCAEILKLIAHLRAHVPGEGFVEAIGGSDLR